jgi:hypothetical protein
MQNNNDNLINPLTNNYGSSSNYNNNVHCEDPQIKIRPIVDHLKKSFAASFYPGKKLCIDES